MISFYIQVINKNKDLQAYGQPNLEGDVYAEGY